MIGYILTETQKNSIQSVQFAPFETFNCVKDINNIWFTFLSDQQEAIVINTGFAWILDCPTGEYVSPPIPLT